MNDESQIKSSETRNLIQGCCATLTKGIWELPVLKNKKKFAGYWIKDEKD